MPKANGRSCHFTQMIKPLVRSIKPARDVAAQPDVDLDGECIMMAAAREAVGKQMSKPRRELHFVQRVTCGFEIREQIRDSRSENKFEIFEI